MKLINTKVTAIAAALSLTITAPATANDYIPYEVYASDQSNSVAGAGGRGLDGSFIWAWLGEDVETQLGGGADAQPIGCDGNNMPGDGPCDIHDVFPGTLEEVDGKGKKTGNTLADLPNFGRLHGMLADPQNRYMNINMFAPNGGYVGIIDGDTKEAISLHRVTSSGTGNTMHMTFWSATGDALYIANLGGRVLERIDIKRDTDGTIEMATFNKGASLFVGKDPSIQIEATAFVGNNAHGNAIRSDITGRYSNKAMSQLTPAGFCKENGCVDGPNAPNGGRANTVIVCPIVTSNDNVYITFGGGGLLVADGKRMPMKIIAEYDQQTVNGAGCGGQQSGDYIWLNAGASASGLGADQSTFTMYAIDDSVMQNKVMPPNLPTPVEVFKDATNTATIGNTTGDLSNNTGQLPAGPQKTTRRDAHGMFQTIDGQYIHQADRIRNNMTVFNTSDFSLEGTYDLTSVDGQGNGGPGPCAAKAAADVPALYADDPAPDLMGAEPNGNYLVVATRGPIPVSVTHAAQGSCPGVGIIELTGGGSSGKLAGVLRTTNTIDDTAASAPGGYAYGGNEHSDPHGASVRTRVEDM